MAGVIGFEPISTVLETAALPLNYTPTILHLLLYQKAGLKSSFILLFSLQIIIFMFFLIKCVIIIIIFVLGKNYEQKR